MVLSKKPREASYIQSPTRFGAEAKVKPQRRRLGMRAISTLLVMTMLALLIVFGSSAASQSSHAYAVTVDGEQVAVLVSQREADEAVKLALTQEEEKLTQDEEVALEYDNQLEIAPLDYADSAYNSVTEAAGLLSDQLDFTATCVKLLIDGEPACYLASATDAIQAVNEAKSQFGSISDENVSAVYTEEQISFAQANANVDELLSVNEAANLLIYGDTGRTDDADAQSMVNVIVERSVSEVAALPYGTVKIDDDTLVRGEEKVISAGVDGTQEITYTVTERNGETLAKAVVGSNVLTAAQDEVVNVGTQLISNGRIVAQLGWPLKDGVGIVSSRYGWRSRGWHSGIDVANDIYTTIVAVEAGQVTYAEYNGGGYGNLVIIDHGDGLSTYYAHCDEFYVSEGDQVERGQAIATVGMTGTTTGPHVHFEVRIDNNAVDPAPYIGAE